MPSPGSSAVETETPSLRSLFFVFLKVSAFTIGGGYVMFPILKRYLVEARQWCTDEELVDYYAMAQSVPGIIAVNTATVVGYRQRGVAGAAAAVAGMITPSLVVIILIAAFLNPYLDNPWVQKAFYGIRGAVVAMLLAALWQVGRKSITSLKKAALALTAFVAIIGFHISPVLLILAGALLGMVLFRKEAEA